MTSASPRVMMEAASPIALADAAQAVTTDVFGPRKLCMIEASPPAMLPMIDVIAYGLIRPGPRSFMTSTCSSNDLIPPIPVPTTMPARMAPSSSCS